MYMTYIIDKDQNKADKDQNQEGPTIATLSLCKSVRRSARNKPQTKKDKSGGNDPAEGKSANRENEISGRARAVQELSPGTSTECRATAAKEGATVACGEEGGKGRGGRRRERSEGGREMLDDSIKCFCDRKVERGEMVCCDVCSGWFHLKCMGMKEGAGLMKGKEFVCHFCVSSVMLKMREEIVGLRRELDGVWNEMKRVTAENESLQSQLVKEGVVEVEARKNMKTGRPKPNEAEERKRESKEASLYTHRENGRAMDQSKVYPQRGGMGAEGQAHESKNKANGQLVPGGAKKRPKQVMGVRKVWGTRKQDSCDDVAKAMVKAVGRVSAKFSVSKRVANVNGKNKWWFIVRAPERSLQSIDKEWKHRYWQWQRVVGRSHPFLEAGPVSDRHR